jgi:hypothetical protein
VIGVLALFLFVLESGSAQFLPALWQNESYWGDGKAEFDFYDAQLVRDGQPRHCEVLHVFVRDTLEPKQSFTQRQAPLSVIRMNQILYVPVGIGVQEQSLSWFWSRDGKIAQFSFVGADTIGNIYKTGARTADGNKFLYECRSYRDGTTSQTIDWPPGDAIFYDELPLRIRTIDFSKRAGEFETQLGPTVVGSNNDQIVFKPATLKFRIDERSIGVDVRHDLGTDHLVLDRDFPFLLRDWQMADGSRLKMKNSLKVDYWNYSKNGDRERALKNRMLRHPD